jgi:hypothetical protein
LGVDQVPLASITARARSSIGSPSRKARITKGALSRPADLTLSNPSRLIAITRVFRRSARATGGSWAYGCSTRATTSRASGSSSSGGAFQPADCNCAFTAESTL